MLQLGDWNLVSTCIFLQLSYYLENIQILCVHHIGQEQVNFISFQESFYPKKMLHMICFLCVSILYRFHILQVQDFCLVWIYTYPIYFVTLIDVKIFSIYLQKIIFIGWNIRNLLNIWKYLLSAGMNLVFNSCYKKAFLNMLLYINFGLNIPFFFSI